MKGWHQEGLVEISKIVHKTACFGVFYEGGRWRGLLLIHVSESANEVGWESKGRRKKVGEEEAEGLTCKLIHTQTHKHRQRSHSQPRHPILSQTGSKMLYFPSKLKCQLILMWRRRVPGTQCTNTQTAFALTDTSLEIQIAPGPAAISWWSHAHGSLRELRAILIGPNVTAHPICHMEVISKLRCSRGWVGGWVAVWLL